MSHYFINDPNLDNKLNKYKVNLRNNDFIFYTQPGVFSKNRLDFGSKLLIENVEITNDIKSIIDIGCGYGPIGLSLAKDNNLNVYMYDINERAIELAKLNAKTNDVTNVSINHNNLLDNISINVDLIVTNPPIRTGKKTIFKLYEQAYERLNKGGLFYCVIQRKQGAPSTQSKLLELFGNTEVITKSNGYWIIKANKE